MRTLMGLLAGLSMLLAWESGLRAAETVPGERRLPRDVVMYVSFRNVADLRAQWPKTLMGQMYQDEALADVRRDFADELAKFSDRVRSQVGMGLEDLSNIPQGEAIAALAMQSDGKPAAVLLLDFGTQEEQVRQLLGRLEEDAGNSDLKRREEEFEETRIVTYFRESDDANAPPRDVAAYFVKETYLAAGSSAAILKSVLNRWDGKQDNILAENPVYRYVTDKCREGSGESGPLVAWYLDPVGIIRAAMSMQPQGQGGMGMGMFLPMLPLIGADKFKGWGGSYDMAQGEFDTVSQMMVYIEPPVRGVPAIFQFDSAAQSPPKWVTAEASSYFTINWNLAKAYQATESLVDSLQGRGALSRLIEQLAASGQAGPLHLKKDMIDLLSGTVHVISEWSDDATDDDEKFLVAAEVKNVAAAKASLRKLSQVPGVEIKEREFNGEALYEIVADDGLAEEGDTTMALSIAENQLVFASDVRLLERLLRGAEGRELLSESPVYRRVAQKFPEKTASIGYSRQDTTLRTLFAALKSSGNPLMGNSGLEGLADKLPSYESLKKYMPAGGSYMQPDERGFKILSFSLKNAE
ncbi:MAG: hypothetical protein ACKV0T_20440 [Planctomycetales bacterium]